MSSLYFSLSLLYHIFVNKSFHPVIIKTNHRRERPNGYPRRCLLPDITKSRRARTIFGSSSAIKIQRLLSIIKSPLSIHYTSFLLWNCDVICKMGIFVCLIFLSILNLRLTGINRQPWLFIFISTNWNLLIS